MGRSSRSTGSASSSRRGRSPRSWGRRGRARARSCTWRPGWTGPPPARVALGDTELAGLSERRLTILRRERIGFVFQAFNLMPSLTVTQNIGLPLRLDGRRAAALGGARGRRAGRAGRPPAPPSLAALRRPAAARRDRPGARHPARGRVRRRADRSARHQHRARRARAPARGRRRGRPHRRDGHPRPRGRGARRPRDPARRRADRRDARRRPAPTRSPSSSRTWGAEPMLRLAILSARGRLGTFTGALVALFASAVLVMAGGMHARGRAAHPSARRALRRRRGRGDRAADRRRRPRRPARRARPRELRARRSAGRRPRRPRRDRRRVGAGRARRPDRRRPRVEQRRADALRAERRTRRPPGPTRSSPATPPRSARGCASRPPKPPAPSPWSASLARATPCGGRRRSS